MEKLGRYDIIGVLGKGAMGLVYEARDPNLDRRVAIKTIKVDNLSHEATLEYEARFRTEARSAARLQHPNIVSVYDSERHGDVAYLVMEFVQGEDLKQHLDSGRRYSLEESLGIVQDLLAALDYAHRENIVHRDVKPANLLVEANGRIKLTDFGVARIQDSGEATRTKGSMVGTLKYMAPEQVQGRPVDARADLFAAGVVLYQLLTAKRPFDGDSEFAIIHQIINDDPLPPSQVNPQLPPAIDAVLARALAKNRDQRYASAQQFADALRQATAQVQDQTIVPPAAWRDRPQGTGTGSGTQRSGTAGSTARLPPPGEDTGSTVTQELELVYWKDIKDSDDVQDLQGFLDRFPQGIYAELAARRLRKLRAAARGESSGTGSTTAGVVSFSVKYNDATLLQTPLAARSASEAGAPLTPPIPLNGNSGSLPASTVAPEPASAAVIPGARKGLSGPVLAVAALVLALMLAIGYKMLVVPGSDTAPGIAVAPQVGQTKPLVTASDAPVAVPTVAQPASAASAALALANKAPAKNLLPMPVDKPRTSKPAVAEPAPAAAAPVPTAQLVLPAPAPASRPVSAQAAAKAAVAEAGATPLPATDPRQACEGRLLLAFQICLNEQCAKPAFANHALCLERKAAEDQRRGAKTFDR